jgi:methylenetetrahydrofolate dehydrogenase (NADP+)/methenyltetrahydrofolate cyclohydrolase
MSTNNKKIDGRKIAEQIYQDLSLKIERLKTVYNSIPNLALISATDDPGIKFYQNMQVKTANKLNVNVESHLLSATTTQDELLSLINKLNHQPNVHGIFIHFPLPRGIDEKKIAAAISPQKDLDGIHPLNQGKLFAGQEGVRPCTPSAVIELLLHSNVELTGKHAVVIGRSNVVGKPLALALLEKNCTVTVCHSKTVNLSELTKQADILVAALGKPGFVKSEHVKSGAVIIDVGTNELDGKMVGDVDYLEVEPLASLITPVPGGVGPVTTALCFKNLIKVTEDAISQSI